MTIQQSLRAHAATEANVTLWQNLEVAAAKLDYLEATNAALVEVLSEAAGVLDGGPCETEVELSGILPRIEAALKLAGAL